MVAVQSGNVSAVAGAAAVGVIATGEGGARAVSGARAVVGEALDAGAVDEIRGAAAQAEALHKWSVKSEMKVTVEAAVGLARKMLGMEADRLDADPWLMNTPSGVVDLRDGSVRPARAGDLMTKLAGVGYVPGADQSVWRGLVSDVCGGDQELMGFLQRWFGYCATGSVREQVFVVHWGGGSNGKGTILETVARVMGDYAVTAAPSLMAGDARGGSERHPTEIASLRGRRMVTAHETDDGAVLREGFVKQATGGDRLVGRFMREDFFEFAPTHKLQLLTNHKPTIRGNDPAIWRRVLLVPYLESFGSAQDVAAGLRTRLADLGLAERLRGDPGALAGVLAWVVDGAVDWAASGLMAPAVVRAAVEEYRSEQDRLGQFVRECCELAPTGLMVALARAAVGSVPWWNDADYRAWSEPMTAGLEGLYPTYAAWCKEMGGHPLARNRFLESLTRSAPRLVAREGLEGSAGAARRRVVRVFGLKLLPQG
jgi:putative DNA primase/helicase